MLEVIIETTEIMIQQSFLQELEKQKAKIIDWLEETHNQFRESNISSEEKVKIHFKNNGIHSIQGWTATTRHEVTRKRSTKRLKDTRNLVRKNPQSIAVC